MSGGVFANMNKFTIENPDQSYPNDLKKLGNIAHVLGMLGSYKLQVFSAIFALLFTAVATLAIGKGINILIDEGLSGQGASDPGQGV